MGSPSSNAILLQFHGRHLLFYISRTAVKYPEQCLLVETLNFRLDRLHIGDIIAIWQSKFAGVNCGFREALVEQGIYLRRDESYDS